MASNNFMAVINCTNVDGNNPEVPGVEQQNGTKTGDASVNLNASSVETPNREEEQENRLNITKPQTNETVKGGTNSFDNNYPNSEKDVCSDFDGLDGPIEGDFFNISDSANSSAMVKDDAAIIVTNESNLPKTIEINNLHSDDLRSDDSKLFTLDTIRATVFRSMSGNSVVISNNNALPQGESIASNNCSLAQLAAYESDDSTDENIEVQKQNYREVIELDSEKGSESDSSSSSSSSSILISSDSSDEDEVQVQGNQKEGEKRNRPIKGKLELGLEDLPPIEDLEISVPEEQCKPAGKVFQIVDRLVLVQSLKGEPAYDLGTVLFTEGGQPLGKIFDVIGPVSEPYYCVRFNSREHIDAKKISVGQMIYSAPETKHTHYVFLAQLMQCKGSDASWEDDLEPPVNCLDYSDDEQESLARKKGQRNRKDKPSPAGSDPDEPARKRHFAYEKKMNRRNLRMTADGNQGRGPNVWGGNMPPHPPFRGFCNQMFGKPPMFSGILGPRAPQIEPISPGLRFYRPPQSGSSSHEMIQTPLVRGNLPNAQQARFTILDATSSPPVPSFCRIPGPGFSSPDFIRTPPPSPNSSEIFRPYPPRLTGNDQPYQFLPSPIRPSNNQAGLRPFPDPVSNPWMNFPPPPPPVHAGARSPLLSSPFWIQKPQNSMNNNFSPFVVPHRPERPDPPRHRPFWPTHPSPVTRPGVPRMADFNPHVPPPSSSDPNQNDLRFNQNQF